MNNMASLTLSKNATSLREEIGMAENAYKVYLQTGETSGMSPHEMRDYIAVRDSELANL
jgi:hypothetical protein